MTHVFFLIGCHVFDFIGDNAIANNAIRRFNKSKFVDLRKRESEVIRPMFGPSGVSIGQILP